MFSSIEGSPGTPSSVSAGSSSAGRTLDAHHFHDLPGLDGRRRAASTARPIRGTRQPSSVSAVPARPLRRTPDGDRRVLLEDAKSDLLDLVAQRGGALELELLGGRLHLGFHPGHDGLDLAPVGVGELAALLRGVDDGGFGDGTQPLVQVADALDDRRRLDAALKVVGLLVRAATVGLVDGDTHRFGDPIGVHDHLAGGVPGSPADHLDERPGRPQEPFLVGVEDRHERHLGEVDPLAQQVDPDQDIEDAEPKVAQDRDALERVDLAVEVLDLHAQFLQVVRQVLGHLLGQGRDQSALAALDPTADLLEQVVDLALGRADGDLWVDDASRPDELLDVPLAALQFIRPRRRAHVDRLVDRRLELLERERPVVERRRQPEPEVDQDLLARPVVLVHADDLRDRHVRLVDDQEPVRREIVEQGPRSRARFAAREMARVVLDPGAIAELAHHLEVEGGPLAEAGAFEGATLGFETGDPLLHLGLDVDDRFLELVLRRHVVRRREDVGLLALGQELAGQRVELGDPLDHVAEELDPDQGLLRGRLEFERVAPDAEPGAAHRRVVALVLEVDQVAQDGIAPVLAAGPQLEHGRAVVDRRAEAVDARDRGHDDHVAPLEQGVGRGMPEPVDLVVARRVLLDVRVAAGQVRLGLVVVEIADEVLDLVLREELAELGIELRGERLVVGQDEGRLVVLLDDF